MENPKAVITGATKGIGRAIAEAFATEGYDIAVCSRHEKDLEALVEAFSKRFPNILVLAKPVDVSQKSEIDLFAQTILNQWNRIDVLVNNAGIYIGGAIHTEGVGVLEKMIETNLYSAYHLSRALLPTMLERRAGYIFNICSTASQAAYPNGGSYSISKYALLGFTKNLRSELKTKGIRVSAVMPGGTWSDSWAGFEAPEDRLMQASDVAKAIIAALHMSKTAIIEEIVMRPQLGDV
jgi:short-subunit dehydrogenase